MTARPDTWMPMYWGDYARDTGHLNAAGHGAYLMLIKHYWCTGTPLRADDNELWRIACCDSKKEWLSLKPRVLRFFEIRDGALYHGRIDKEIKAAAEAVSAKSKAGKKGAENRWQKDGTAIALSLAGDAKDDGHVNGDAIVLPMPRQCEGNATSPSPSPVPLTTFGGGEPPGSAIPIRDVVWQQGLPILRAITGKPEGACRAFLGRLLKTAGDDCARVFNALQEAQKLRPVDPEAWLTKASQPPVRRPAAAAWNP